MANQTQQQPPAAGRRQPPGPRRGAAAPPPPLDPQIHVAGQAARRRRHARQAPRRPGQGDRPRRSTPSTSIAPACSTRGSSARRIRTRAIVSVDLSAAQTRARRQGGARASRPGRTPDQRVMFQGDEVAAVAADTEEHAIDAARLVKVEYEVLPHVTSVEQALAGTRAAGVHRRQRARRARRRKPAISRPASRRPRTRSRRPTRRTSSRTSASSRTARCASGTATS